MKGRKANTGIVNNIVLACLVDERENKFNCTCLRFEQHKHGKNNKFTDLFIATTNKRELMKKSVQ